VRESLEGRFKSCLVQSEQYLLACHRYIELNPVRAGLARRADEYPWSSYCANARGDSCEILTPHDEYLRLGRTPAERQATYRDLFSLVHPGQLEEIRSATNGGFVLGAASFKATTARALGRRVEKGIPGRPTGKGTMEGQLGPGWGATPIYNPALRQEQPCKRAIWSR
jgi:putative transposase